jgi:hypothetical protein
LAVVGRGTAHRRIEGFFSSILSNPTPKEKFSQQDENILPVQRYQRVLHGVTKLKRDTVWT